VDNIVAAKLLIAGGANVNSLDKELWTPLHIASAFSRVEIIELLLEVSSTLLDMPTFVSCKFDITLFK